MYKTNNSYDGVSILDYQGDNYKTVMSYDKWRIAYLNYGERYTEKAFSKMERHMQTDEVFVLLEGNATLVIGKEQNKIKMEPHKVYNVQKGTWHHIFVCKNTKVLIVENEDTCSDNTEYMEIS